MSKLKYDHVFTSEAVGSGHPDKVCDQVSDAVLDACLAADKDSRVACETLVAHDLLINAGEITCKGMDQINTENIARDIVRDIGYDCEDLLFWDQSFEYMSKIHEQSPDISMGVTEGMGLYEDQGAGDQGMMFGYATNETPEFMPAPIAYSHRLLQYLDTVRKEGKLSYLRPDSKSQVSIKYVNGKPDHITTVVVSQQTDDVPLEKVRNDIVDLVNDVLEPTGLLRSDTEYFINPTGSFVLGGPYADAGLTGRKIIVDTYGGVGSHGGGAFSGKDPSKVDRSAAYYARHAAKNIVAAGLADKCEIQVAYAIGVAKPLSINVDTYGTGVVEDQEIQDVLESGEIFDFRPAALIDDLELLNPKGWSYREASTYGHFGRDIFPWEQLDKVDSLREKFNLNVVK
ncbi:S-adenosylmethionine synthetase [Methanohalobium evestigatum Z-7303]|uniref:Methionine adenosyltransferase n=1 Tax=Methanohalobium evestigatum (strain ATCC BAA-1072 / DSM 3721 / NBRC 107634 / OCM 161 / Z-7303) TaxID=644295 RepID=D7E779_METEZ|nr:methionine adenosyltransferase [Methanohalobium evestigatum]ADI73828.1 S-adenosylmethionine synthetase [Methanohalobium evestigatum Z-7303]